MPLTNAQISELTGLSQSAAAEQLKKYGPNELPSSRRRGILKIALEIVSEPMIFLLIACAALYFFIGDRHEALLLLGSVLIVVGITLVQENRTEKTLTALRDLSSPLALVIRDGAQIRLPGREVVPGDLLFIREGDRVAADAVLLWNLNLSADESFLTGESVPVRKTAGAEDAAWQRAGGDGLPFIYSGSLVVEGQGIAKVLGTGLNTEIGKIGKSLQKIQPEKTFLQKEVRRIVGWFFLFAVITCALVVIGYGYLRGDWLTGAVSGIALAISVLPEEFPVILTVFLAMGAWRLSQKKVLARRLAAVEILGAATVLCVDKTGTLTENQMSVKKLVTAKGEMWENQPANKQPLPETWHALVEYAVLASKKEPFDPMEKALKQLGRRQLQNTEHLHTDWSFFHEYPLSPELLALTHVWETADGHGYAVAAKGAPEAIMELCHLTDKEKTKLETEVKTLASEGLRVIAVAETNFTKKNLPASQHDFDFKFLGLIGLADPIRSSVPAAIKECTTAGIRVVMITGDYPVTATNIAKQIGLPNAEQVITGQELLALTPEELQKKIKTVNIFARMVPEQKLALVAALKTAGEVVAMTGDGVNDAPALKAAHIGVAMGKRGTDVAREAADLVLGEDDFGSLVGAVRLGRRIFDNLRKAMAYVISMHAPIAGMAFWPLISGSPMILYPIHIVFLELIIDPACSIVFEAEPEEKNIMTRPPRNPAEPLFRRRMFLISLMQGVAALALIVVAREFAAAWGLNDDTTRTLTFSALIFSNLCLILANRSWTKGLHHTWRKIQPALFWVFGGALGFLALCLYLPALATLFHFSYLPPKYLLLGAAAGLINLLLFEVFKLFCRWRKITLLS